MATASPPQPVSLQGLTALESPEFSLLLAVCMWPPSPARAIRLQHALEQPINWHIFQLLVRRHCIAGLAWQALSHADCTVPIEVHERLKKRAEIIAREGLRAAAESARLAARLGKAGIPCLVIKGAPLAVLAYQSVAIRHSRDTDLLVSSRHAIRADAILRAEGFERHRPSMSLMREHFLFFVENRSQAEYVHANKQQAELHVRLQDNPAFGSMLEAGAAKAAEVDLGGGHKVYTLNELDMLPYLCVHGAKHAWFRLKWLADVGALLAADAGAGARLLATARTQGTERAAMQALVLCNRFWQIELPAEMPPPDGAVQRLVNSACAALSSSVNELESKEQSFGNNPVRLSFLLFSGHPVRLMQAVLFEIFVSTDFERLPSNIQFLHPVLRFPMWLAERTVCPRWLIRQGLARHRDLWLLARALGWLLTAWLAIDVLPGKLYRKLMQPAVRQKKLQDDKSKEFIARVRWAVQAAAKRVPWRSVCFHQGIAAQQILCRSGVAAELHYGVAKSDSKGLDSHVWVTAEGKTVVGGGTSDRFTVLAIFQGLTPE